MFFVWVLFLLDLKSWKIQTVSVPGYSFSCLWINAQGLAAISNAFHVGTGDTSGNTTGNTTGHTGSHTSNARTRSGIQFSESLAGWMRKKTEHPSFRNGETQHFWVFSYVFCISPFLGVFLTSRFGSANLEVIQFVVAKELYGKLFPSVRVAMEIWYTQNTLMHWWTSEWAFVEISEFLDSLLLMNFLGWTLFWRFCSGVAEKWCAGSSVGMRSAVLDEVTALQWRSRRLLQILRAWKDPWIWCGNGSKISVTNTALANNTVKTMKSPFIGQESALQFANESLYRSRVCFCSEFCVDSTTSECILFLDIGTFAGCPYHRRWQVDWVVQNLAPESAR